MKYPLSTFRRGKSVLLTVIPAIVLVSLLAGPSPGLFPDDSTVETVLFEPVGDGVATIVRIRADKEIPWYALAAEEGSQDLRLTLLNTKLNPDVSLAEAEGLVASYKLYEQGSRVFFEAVLTELGLSVTVGPEPNSFDLLLTISPVRPTSISEEVAEENPHVAVPPAPEPPQRVDNNDTDPQATSSNLPGTITPTKAAPKQPQMANAEDVMTDVQRLFSATLKKSAVPSEPNPAVVSSHSERWRLDTVVLDAGHGGWDNGAFGKAGFLEKDLALLIALRVGRLIEEQLGVNVVYTRTDDRFIPVSERGRIANAAGGKLFVSIHANYSMNRQAHGTETYFLGTHRSDSAKVVMERENRVVQLEDDTVHYSQYDNAASARGALAQSSFMRHSAWLAEAVQQQFTDVVRRRDRGVKQAGFYVLFGASMPSILIELGFLSNPSEEKFLSSADGQTSMANAIFKAIQNFKMEYEKSLPVASE